MICKIFHPGSPCVFPFEVYNLTITGCTRIDGDPAAWCATQTDSQVRDQSEYSYILVHHKHQCLL